MAIELLIADKLNATDAALIKGGARPEIVLAKRIMFEFGTGRYRLPRLGLVEALRSFLAEWRIAMENAKVIEEGDRPIVVEYDVEKKKVHFARLFEQPFLSVKIE